MLPLPETGFASSLRQQFIYTDEVRIMALCGSLRLRSSNRALLLAAQRHAPEGMDVSIFDSIRDLPHFDPDLDGPERDPEDRPDGVLRLRRALAASDALLISTPEYAHGLPGSLKNALDWLVSSPAMIGKPVALIYGSTGEANYAQEQLKEILTTMSAVIVRDAIIVVLGVRSKIDNRGAVSDPQLALQIESALRALAAFVCREQ
jgi:chromate reductase, NAD(P)H dehydrogenase (quinone)